MSERVLVFGEALLDDFGDQQIVGGAPSTWRATWLRWACPH